MQLKANALYANLLRDLRPHMSVRDLWAFRKEGPRIFDDKHMKIRRVRSIQLAAAFLKKLEPDQSDKADSKALLEFLNRNFECSNWRLVLDSDRDHLLLGELKQLLHRFFEPENGRSSIVQSDYHVLSRGRVGPGASLGSSGKHYYNKMFSGPITTSHRELYFWYKDYISRFPDWASAEMHRSMIYGEAPIVEDNSLGFVPKERSKSRVICTEKSLDMFYQLGLASIIEDRLATYWGIDIRNQPSKNRELSRLGSLCGFDGLNFCTVDLKCASDMPFSMAAEVYPRTIMSYLKRYRSRTTFIPGLGSRQLDILSSMGNGFTFPLQTTLFAAIILACYRLNGVKPEFPFGNSLGNFGVFGDDLVFHSSCKDDVYRLLTILGFTINKTKSFSEGSFRESCGSDYYNGVNVRGVYIKRLKTPQDRYSAFNALIEWSAKSSITLQRTVSHLFKSVKFVPIPRWENDDSGLRMPFQLALSAVNLDPKSRRTRQWDVVGYKAYVPSSVGWTVSEAGFSGPRHLIRYLTFNPFGIWLTYLQGSLENGRATTRCRDVRYRLVNKLTPCWDSDPYELQRSVNRESPFYDGGSSWERWNTASYLNLSMT